MLTGVTITNGGNGYDVGDSITITDSSYVGFGAVASVSTTTADQVSNITISNSGNGYQINDVIVFDNADTNADVTAEATIATLKDTFQQDVITSQVYEAITTKSFSLNKSLAVTVLGGYLVANHSTNTSATKIGEFVYLRTSFRINNTFTSGVDTSLATKKKQIDDLKRAEAFNVDREDADLNKLRGMKKGKREDTIKGVKVGSEGFAKKIVDKVEKEKEERERNRQGTVIQSDKAKKDFKTRTKIDIDKGKDSVGISKEQMRRGLKRGGLASKKKK